jgi:hypothetical protein
MLTVSFSLDCGANWSLRYSKSGGSLMTTSVNKPTGWIPSASDWRNESVSLPASLKNQPNVRFKFESISANGQNIYIDNINISPGNVGIEVSNSSISSFSVYPNPSKGQMNVSITLEKISDLKMELFDITGRKVADIADEKNISGVHNFLINTPLQDGVYFVQLTSGSTTASRRIIVLE